MIHVYEVIRVTEERFSVEVEGDIPTRLEVLGRIQDPYAVRIIRETVRPKA